MQASNITPEQKSFFRESGYLILKRALAKERVGPVKEHVLNELKRLKIWSSGKTLSASIKETPAFQQITKLSGLIKLQGLESKVINHDVRSVIDSLTEGKVAPALSQLLISLPNQGDWTLRELNWHTDISSSARHSMPGIQAFILIDDVKAHGGGTLAIARSHLSASCRESRKKIREMLQKNGHIESKGHSSNLSIVEMSGPAGDVHLMDMRLLHTPSINSTKSVRMMATVRYLSV